jgi:hypothetical protein
MPAVAGTELVISGEGVPPYSARGLQQTLGPIDSVVPARDVNGGLINLAPSQFRKFKSTLSCTDGDPPAFGGLWPGATITVDCVAEVPYLTPTGTPPVGGSPPPGRTVVGTRTEGAYTFVRLRLSMMVMGPWTLTRDEPAHTYQWQIDLEEV